MDRPAFVRVADAAVFDVQLRDPANQAYPRVIHVAPNGEAALPILEFLFDLEEVSKPFWAPSAPREDAADVVRRARPDALFGFDRRVAMLDRARTRSLVVRVDVEFRSLVQAACDVISALHACRSEPLRQAAESLQVAAVALGPGRCNAQTVPWADYLQTFADEVISTFEQGTTYVHVAPTNAHKSWWRAPPEASQRCARAQSALFPLSASPPTNRVRTWLTALRTEFDAMHLSPGTSPAVAFERASAWYAGCAIRHYEQEHLGFALLFLHRAVEWMMMTKMAQAGYLDFTRPGGEYKAAYQVNNVARPSFSASMSLLSLSPGFMASFAALNDWRNLLPYTHHMSVAQQATARTLIGKVVDDLPRFAQSTSWVAAAKVFTTPLPLGLEDLLDPDGTLRNAAVAV